MRCSKRDYQQDLTLARLTDLLLSQAAAVEINSSHQTVSAGSVVMDGIQDTEEADQPEPPAKKRRARKVRS